MGKGKRTPFFLFSLLLLLLSAAVFADDSSVMSALREALSPTPSGWSDSKSYCSWTNVNCDSSNRVTFINLDTQSLSGTLPTNLGSLTELRTLTLQRNKLTGEFPSLANLNSLQSLSFDSNNFTSIPAGCFKGLTSLQTLSLSDNLNLEQWSIPTDLSESTNLVNFYADNAQINGSLPDFLGSIPGLQNIRLSYNYLTGPLPSTLGGSSIQNLWLNNQLGTGLSGTLEVLSSMEQLSQVWLQKNDFTGPIPDLSKCKNLFDLQLRDNELTGTVPTTSLFSISSLQNLTLDNNKLQGPAPDNPNKIKLTYDGNNFCNGNTPGPCDPQVTTLLQVAGALGYPTTLADSWSGNDACKSWVFISCQESKVITVNLGKQNFKGTISPAFANLTSLQKLYLNNNNLTGSIPTTLTTLTQLQVLDVSNNNLSGPVPVFPATVKLTTTGNPFIGKNVTTGDGPTSSPGSGTDSPSSSPNKTSSSAVKIALIVVSVVVLVVLMSFCYYKYCYLKRPRRFNKVANPESGSELVIKNWVVNGGSNSYGGVPSELQSQSSGDHNNDIPVSEGGNVAISIQMLRQVTDNFNEKNILGRGGFGVVYKGELSDGTMIAVKRMESVAMGNKGMNEFQAEIAVLTKVRHRHLVALIGYCTTDNERLLVYEYMPQGTLTQHLFEWQERGLTVPLTWKQRVTIALDVARGVEYLHSLAQQSFIHRDLKPSNILLSDDMRAKVADFGLVKNAPDGKYSVETRLAGTFGYLAPEYAATGRVTTKVDVYAFGVVLMELITGRKALDDSVPDERSHLVTWFRRVLINKENIPKAIDQSLNPNEETMESIYKVAELAGHCTAREPFQRPDMGHAVNILGPLVEQWKPSQREEEDDGYGNMSLPQALQRWQADEGTSRMFDDNSMSFSQTQTSIASKPSGFPDSFHSSDCR